MKNAISESLSFSLSLPSKQKHLFEIITMLVWALVITLPLSHIHFKHKNARSQYENLSAAISSLNSSTPTTITANQHCQTS